MSTSLVKPAELDSKNFEIVANIDKISNDFIESAQSTINKLISAKVELHKNKAAVED